MTYQRDPMSVRFDPQAKLVISLAIDQHRKHVLNGKLVPWVRIRVPNTPLDVIREDRPDRLSQTERAMSRALYYDSRIHQLSSRRKPDARWSLKLTWETVPLVPGQARYVKVQVFTDTSGARHVEDKPRTSWVENPELRSTYQAERQGLAG